MTDTTERTPTPRLPAAERRQRLLEAALERFAADGYAGASMNDVAEAAGVTKPVLYQHFASKEALYRELVLHVGTSLEQAIVTGLAGVEGPRQQVEAGFRAYFRWAIGESDAFRVLFTDRNRADEHLAAAVARVEAVVADLVASLIQVEGLGRDQRQVLAFGIVGIAESTSRHWLQLGLGPGIDADAFADQVAKLAWNGLRGIQA